MAAGLAPELNNPASAAKRASSDLADALEVLSSTIGVFVESGVSREQAGQLVQIQRAMLEACRARATISQLELADAEDELTGALEDAGIADAYRIVEPLAQAGFDAEQLQRVKEHANSATEAAVRWIAASLLARELAAELSESTERMSKLVGAVKMYAYMDRGGLVEVDVREGLDTTLTILGHKLKHTTIVLKREIDDDLPRFQAYGAELNQVWTNLLDNAIDALGESGTITISAHRDGDCVEVDIADDGPGVPAEAAERIFDPFFTTKEVGKGTGLGLDTARRIIVDRHHGSLTLRTEPGQTVFRVRLPVAQSAE
jgi:signal transduction histidine kinase